MNERWTTARCAHELGITEGRWRSCVSQGRRVRKAGGEHWAPEPVGYDLSVRRLVWDADAVRRGHASRPGRGARTDLRNSIEPKDGGQP